MSLAKGLKGAKLYIGPAQATDATQTEYEALTWVEIKDIASIGEFGTEETMNVFSPLDGVNGKYKGNIDAGNPSVEYAYVYDDAGQVALRAAGDTNLAYAFKIELNDAPAANMSKTIFYSRGLVKAPKQKGGAGDDYIGEMTELGLVQLAIKVDPAVIP